MYCATVFCLHVIYSSASASLTYIVAPPKGGVLQYSIGRMQVYFPVIQWAALCCNPPIALLTWRVTDHVSDLKIITAWSNALKKVPNVRASFPSRPSILDIFYHFLRAFCRLATTAIQSSSVTIRMRPSYLKFVILVSRQPYALKSLSVYALVSSATNLHHFLSAPMAH